MDAKGIADQHARGIQPSLLWLAAGTRDSAGIRAPVARLVGTGVEVVVGEVEKLDPSTRIMPDWPKPGKTWIPATGAEAIRDAIAKFAGAGS